MFDEFLSNLVNEIGIGWFITLLLLLSIVAAIPLCLLLLKFLFYVQNKKQTKLQEFVANKNIRAATTCNDDKKSLMPTSVSFGDGFLNEDVLLKNVNSKEEAFFEIRKFLKANNIKSTITKVKMCETYDKNLGRKTKIKTVTTPISWWDSYQHKICGGKSDQGIDLCFTIRYGSAPSYEKYWLRYNCNSEDDFSLKYGGMENDSVSKKVYDFGECMKKYLNYIPSGTEVI